MNEKIVVAPFLPMERPLTTEEASLGTTISILSHALIRKIDLLAKTPYYTNRLKYAGKMFIKELEETQAATIWSNSGSNLDKAVNQMDTLCEFVQNILTTALALDSQTAKVTNEFWQDMNEVAKKHNIPLSYTANHGLIHTIQK